MRRMSTITIGNLPRLSSKALSDILLSHASSNLDASSKPENLAIIDVRDDGTSIPGTVSCLESILPFL